MEWGLLRAGAPVSKHQFKVFHVDKAAAIYVTTGGSHPVLKYKQQVSNSNMTIVVGIRACLWTLIEKRVSAA